MGVLDWIISVGAVALMFGQGWWFSRKQKTTEDYFVGGRRMNWLAVGLSMFATTFSPLSFVGQPREAAYDNYHLYLAILFIPLFAAPLAGWLFVPVYHRLRLTSAYEYLEMRFDRRVRRCGSLLSGLYTLAWMGCMLYATSLIVQAALGLDKEQRIATMVLLGITAAYTTVGGYQAAVWTNVIKAAILAGVVVAVLLLTVGRIEGGWAAVFQLGRDNGKFDMFDMRFDLEKRAQFFSACAFGMFVYLSVAVTGQAAIQRYVSMPTVAAARRSLAVNAAGTGLVCLLFFLLGTSLFAFYHQNPASAANIFPDLDEQDQITMHFVRTELGYPGLVGLLLAGLLTAAMGSISSGLSALSAVVVCDWMSGRKLGVRESRIMSGLFGAAAILMALVVPLLGKLVFDIIIGVSGALFGLLLGVFLLGICVPRANAQGTLIGLAVGAVSLGIIVPTTINSWWYGAFTCIPTLVAGTLASLFYPAPPPEKLRGLLASWNGTSTIEGESC